MLKFTSAKLTGDYTHYFSKDPAFDFESERFNYEAWLDTGDESHLPLKEGQKPTRFTFGRLGATASAFCADRALDDSGGTVQSMTWYVRLALKKVDPIDSDMPAWELVIKHGMESVSDDWMRMIQLVFQGDVFRELALRVMQEESGSPRD